MAIPKEILAVQRPSSTVVKQRGTRFVVIKRTSKRVDNRVIPIDLGTVGEIIDGRYVERKTEAPKKTIDIKDYGEVALCNKYGKDLLDELAKVWDLNDAKRLYTIALLRAAYGDIKNRDLMLQYATSFASEIIPGVHLSEDAVSAFLQEIGQAYSMICEFMRNRVQTFAGKNIVVDGMLKDYNSLDGYMSEFSRKARTKGSKDMSLLYAFNPKTKEPIAAKPYPGNMLDQTSIDNFVAEYKIVNGMMIFDKGFYNEALFEKMDKMEGLSYLIPLKQNSAFIKNYGMDNPTEHLKGYTDATILYKKMKMSNGKYLYAFRDPKMAYEQEVAYVQQAQKKETFDSEKYIEKKSLFGLIVFKSKKNLDPLTVYLAYSQRWQIETMFNLYKNIIDRDTINVHTDYRVYATELINFLSVIITTRVKNEIVKKELNKKYSYKQIFRMLSKYKKVRTDKDGLWEDVTKLKYIEELTKNLDVQGLKYEILQFTENSRYLKDVEIPVTGDVLVLTGDTFYLNNTTAPLSKFWKWASANYKQVLLVPGNHEYYQGCDVMTRGLQWKWMFKENVGYYQNQVQRIGDTDFILSTLWSHIPPQDEYFVSSRLNDFYQTKFNGKRMTVEDYNSMHEYCLDFIRKSIGESTAKHIVVVTHHLPTLKVVASQHLGSDLNSAFATELGNLIADSRIDVWIYGHSHTNIDKDISGVKIISNQMGYVFANEHLQGGFDAGKFIEITKDYASSG